MQQSNLYPLLILIGAGREAHVMTFEVGAVLEDAKWQVPAYCFAGNKSSSQAFSISTAPPHHQIHRVLRGSMAV